jgi:hypothetical protein
MLTARAYWIVLTGVFLGLCAVKGLYDRAVEMTCWAGGYQQDAWMAYCNSERYGVYDTEAIWNSVESEAVPEIQAAKVLTLTDSHMQNALSLGGASEWFAARGVPFYMLGVPHNESGFGERLLEKLQPRPEVMILDASPFFTGDVGPFERGIFSDPVASRDGVVALKDFQAWHQHFCTELPAACGHNFAYFRARRDGHWIFPAQTKDIWIGWHDVPNDNQRYPTGSFSDLELKPRYPQYLANARKLVAMLKVPPQCIVMTSVPADYDLRSLAEYLGKALGVTVIDPNVGPLYTFDRAHLTPESSTRWTRAFLQELDPVIDRCQHDRYPTAVASAPNG